MRHTTRRAFLGRSAGLAGALLLSRAVPSVAAAGAPSRPVILVHGFGDRASIWQRGDNALVRRLVEAGYRWEPGELAPYSYPAPLGVEDSQGDIGAAGLALAERIRALAARTAAGQVDLLGFSMGGLVGRWAINHLRETRGGARPLVHTAVMVGTPNNGADILVMLSRLSASGQAAIADLARELASLDLASVAARQMLPNSDFLAALNRATQADELVRYAVIAGSVDVQVGLLSMGATFNVGDGLISALSAGYLPGLTPRSYVVSDRLGASGEPLWQAVRRSSAFHGQLLFNDSVALAAASELAPAAGWPRSALDERLETGQIALAAGD